MSAKEKIIKDTQAALKGLEAQKKKYEQLISSTPFLSKHYKTLMEGLDVEIKKTKKLLAELTSATDLVTKVTQKAANEALAVLDSYIEKYGNHEKELVNLNSPNIPIASIGIISAVVSIGLVVEAKLESKRTANKVESKGSISSKGYLKVGVQVGFSAPVIGKLAVTGGIQGSANLLGVAKLELEAALPDLAAYMNPAAIDFSLSASLYLDFPTITGLETVLGWVAGAIPRTSVKGCSLFFKLGTLNVLTVTTPVYSIKFSMVKGKFHSAKASGKYSAKLNKKITDTINYIVQQIKYWANKLNPVNILGDAWDAAGSIFSAIW